MPRLLDAVQSPIALRNGLSSDDERKYSPRVAHLAQFPQLRGNVDIMRRVKNNAK